MKFWHVFYPVWRSYIFFVSFVQSPFKEALRDLSCSSDLSELAVPREKGSALDKNLQKNSIREWLLLAPRHQPPSHSILGYYRIVQQIPPKFLFHFENWIWTVAADLNIGCEGAIFKYSKYHFISPSRTHKAVRKVPTSLLLFLSNGSHSSSTYFLPESDCLMFCS